MLDFRLDTAVYVFGMAAMKLPLLVGDCIHGNRLALYKLCLQPIDWPIYAARELLAL